MKLSRSSYYYQSKRENNDREQEDLALCDKIEYLQANYSCYGYRTIKPQLQAVYGIVVNGKRIKRVMREHGLFWKAKLKFVRTTDSKHSFRIYPNLVQCKELTGINQVWAADITYIRIHTGFVFLAILLDVYSRRIVGWALSKRIDHRLTVAALTMALAERKPGPGLIHHSDQGVQYACQDYVDILTKHNIQMSMASRGNPYQNAYAESFMKTLKKEEVYLWEYETFEDVVERIPEFIEEVYNRKRVHSGINYLTPEKFEINLCNEMGRNQSGQATLIL